jgi:hypothetical protein
MEDSLDRKLREIAERDGISYKEAVNLALRKGLERLEVAESPIEYRINPFSAGLKPGIDPDKLNQLSDEPELGK